jgi:hypothetical protein
VLRKQLDAWRQPLDEDPAVEEAVLRMLQSLDRYTQHRQAQPESRA